MTLPSQITPSPALTIQHVLSELAAIAQHYPTIEKILLFGSRARGDHQPQSDIDLAIVAPHITTTHWLELCEKIEQLNTLLEIDVVNFNQVNPQLQNKINQEGKVIYEHHHQESF